MSVQDRFSEEEWSSLCQAPHWVSMAVATSGASGVIGTLKEAFSGTSALVEGMQSNNPLLQGICTREQITAAQKDLRETVKAFDGSDAEAVKEQLATHAVERVQVALAALSRSGDADDPETYGAFLKDLGQRVAEAAKEGGFFGFGGERVSEGERQMLARLEDALSRPT